MSGAILNISKKQFETETLKHVMDCFLRTGDSFFTLYRNDPKFSDRYAWANSADPDQTAPRGAV